MTFTGQELLDLYFYARAMSWRSKLDAYEAEAVQTILATLDAGRAEILAEFQRRYADLSDIRAERLQAVLEEMEAMTAGLRKGLAGQYESMTSVVASASLSEAATALSLGGLLDVGHVALSPDQLRAFVSTPLGGDLIQDWVDRSFDATVQAQMRQGLNVGVLKGEGYPGLVKRLETGFDLARNESISLARTFVSSANNRARDEVFQKNADIVKQWKWLTAGDNRVCMLCLPLHGQKFNLGEGPSRPRHVRCRCQALPVTVSWRELGINMEEFQGELDRWVVRGQAGEDGEIVVRGVGAGGQDGTLRISRHATAQDWYDGLGDVEKRSTSLGPGRVKLLDEGKITIRDLIGPDFKARTLKELESLT